MEFIQELLSKCKDCLIIFFITLSSMISGHRPHITDFKDFGVTFFTNLSYVSLVLGVAIYFGLNSILSVALAYALGRWSYLLDNKIHEFFSNNTLEEIIKKLKGKQ
jgi:hypothetical protein